MPFEASYLGYAFASAALVYAAVAWFGDRHLSQEYKENLTLWLWGEYESSWSYHYCKFFDAVFGERHLSWRCFFRSTIASIFAVLFFYLLFAEMLSIMQPGGRAGGYLPLAQVALFGILINIIPDYISLYETRWLLKRFGRAKGIHRQLGILIVDLVVTTLIIAPVIALFQWLIGEEGSSIVEIAAVFSAYSLFFYSTFLTSLWAWIFFPVNLADENFLPHTFKAPVRCGRQAGGAGGITRFSIAFFNYDNFSTCVRTHFKERSKIDRYSAMQDVPRRNMQASAQTNHRRGRRARLFSASVPGRRHSTLLRYRYTLFLRRSEESLLPFRKSLRCRQRSRMLQ